jgi:peroxidase
MLNSVTMLFLIRTSHVYVIAFSQLMLRIFTGAHTVGVAEWQFFVDRLYNFLGTGLPDPNLDPTYGNYLRNICPEAN